MADADLPTPFFSVEATFKASGVPAASEDAAGGVGFKSLEGSAPNSTLVD